MNLIKGIFKNNWQWLNAFCGLMIQSLTIIAYVVTLRNSGYQTAFQRGFILFPYVLQIVCENCLFWEMASYCLLLHFYFPCVFCLASSVFSILLSSFDSVSNFHIDSKLKIGTTLHRNTLSLCGLGRPDFTSHLQELGLWSWSGQLRGFIFGIFAGNIGKEGSHYQDS